MEHFKYLPRKCYACQECQKFTPALENERICLICSHYEAQHEQVCIYNLIILVFKQVYMLTSIFFK